MPRSLSLVLVVTLLTGCGGSETKPDTENGGGGAPATKPQPAPAPPPKKKEETPKPAPSDEPPPIVIKGKKDSAPGRSSEKEKPNQAKIDELKQKAKDSQGKGGPDTQPVVEEPSHAPDDGEDPIKAARKRELKNSIAALDKEFADLKAEYDSLQEEQTVRQGRQTYKKMVSKDEARTAAITARVEEMKVERQKLVDDLAPLEKKEKKAPK